MSPSTGSIAQYITRQARKIPGLAQAEGEVKGTFAQEKDLPIKGYDKLTAAEINERLTGLSQIELATLDAYERKGQNRTTVLGKLTTLRGSEPWLGYDELTAVEIEKLVGQTDDPRKLKDVRAYEQAHKDRATVVGAAGRGLAHAAS